MIMVLVYALWPQVVKYMAFCKKKKKNTDRQRGCLQLLLQAGNHLLLLFHLLPQHPGLEKHIRDLKDNF